MMDFELTPADESSNTSWTSTPTASAPKTATTAQRTTGTALPAAHEAVERVVQALGAESGVRPVRDVLWPEVNLARAHSQPVNR